MAATRSLAAQDVSAVPFTATVAPDLPLHLDGRPAGHTTLAGHAVTVSDAALVGLLQPGVAEDAIACVAAQVPALTADVPSRAHLRGWARAVASGVPNPAWMGSTRAEAMDRLATGDDARADRLRTIADRLRDKVPAPASIRRRHVWTDDGDDVRVDRVVSGDWDTALRGTRKRTTAAAPTVTLVAPWTFSSNLSAGQVDTSAATLYLAADLLTEAGYSVALTLLGIVASGATDVAVTLYHVKDAAAPLTPSSLAARTSVYCYRWAAITASALAARRVNRSLGPIGNIAGLFPALVEAGLLPSGSRFVPQATHEHAAIEAVTDLLARIAGGSDA